MSLKTEELADRMLRRTRNCVDSACKMMFPSSSQGFPCGDSALEVSVLKRFAGRWTGESDMVFTSQYRVLYTQAPRQPLQGRSCGVRACGVCLYDA
jgi:hypothetical protein